MNEEDRRTYIKAQRAAGVPLRVLAEELGIDKMSVDRIAKSDENGVVDRTKPRDLKHEAKVTADYAQATPETKDDVIWVETQRWDLDGTDDAGRTELVAIRKWNEDTHAWDEELAAFRKLTTEEKLETFRWRMPKVWPSFLPADRHYGVGRDDVTSWTHAFDKPMSFYPAWPSDLVKLLSQGIGEDVEKLLDRTIREKYKGTGRVDKQKVTQAFRWLVMEVELQRQANLSLRWELLTRPGRPAPRDLKKSVRALQTRKTVLGVVNAPDKVQPFRPMEG